MIQQTKARLAELRAAKAKALKIYPEGSTKKLDALIEQYENEAHKLEFGRTCCNEKHTLATLNRKLTESEKNVNWNKLAASFDKEEKDLKKKLDDIIQPENERVLTKLEKILASGAILGLLALQFNVFNKAKVAIRESMLSSYERGRKSASSEVKIDRSTISNYRRNLIRVDSEIAARNIQEGLTQDLQSFTVGALVVGATAIGIAARERMRKETARYTTNAVASLPGNYINIGRTDVFDNAVAQKKIVGYQRSEILDDRICPMCESLDGRFVLPDDPMRKLTVVHSNCRGTWIAVLNTDDLNNPGIPKTIMNNFDLVGGTPIMNNFKQLKKPIND